MTGRLTWGCLAVGLLAVTRAAPALSEDASPATVAPNPAPEKVQQAIDRSLKFLIEDAATWRKDRGCATCHHGAMTVWALTEARSQGFAVPAETLDDTVKWTKDLLVPQFSKPRDPRWGFNFVSLPGIYLSVMSQTLPILSRDEINRVALHLARHQEQDGAWLLPPPNANTSPPTWESSETIVLWALLAWEPRGRADSAESAFVEAAREKAIHWLDSATPTDTNQVDVLRLLLRLRSGRPAEEIARAVDRLLDRQDADGGWSQLKELSSDAYATGQALWALSFAGVRADHPQIARAVSFLVATQGDNGAWPMSRRSHSERDVSRDTNLVPITHLGSAWATLGLVRFVSPLLDSATAQARAIASIRNFSGTYETDQKLPGNPLVSAKIVYEIDDDQLASLAKLLAAIPGFRSLQLKSPHLTDDVSKELTRLSQLRNLSLEQAALTDAGLARLKALPGLEELNLKGTKVTAVGIADFQRTLPGVKVQAPGQ